MKTKHCSYLFTRSRIWISVLCTSLAFIVLSVAKRDASALTINCDYIGGTPPENTVGGGDLIEIFRAAANQWERAILDPYTVTLHFGWAQVGERGEHILFSQGGEPNREIYGVH